MDLTNFPWTEILALIGVIGGPLAGYFAAKRMTDAKILLMNIDAIQQWSDRRRAFEDEIAELHEDLALEQKRRRDEREEYLDRIAKLRGLLRVCASRLNTTIEELCPDGECDESDLL